MNRSSLCTAISGLNRNKLHQAGAVIFRSPSSSKGEVMREIHICSLKELKYLLREGKIDINNSYALISSSYPLDIPELSHMDYLFECYDDIDFDCLGRVFSIEAANRFSRAIKENDKIQHFWCVCDGGVRRSSAVAASILRFLGTSSRRDRPYLEQSQQRAECVGISAHVQLLGCSR